MIKLSVGSESIDTLAEWQAARLARDGALWHRTRMMPRRREDLLAGGSIYWVIRGVVQARQRLVDIVRVTDEEGLPDTHLMLDSQLVPVEPRPHRPFQGWRYLPVADAPPDLGGGGGGDDLPPELVRRLADLGLL